MNQTKQIKLQNVEIDKLKAEQVVDRKTIQDNKEINIKEIYERVVKLETVFEIKFSDLDKRNTHTRTQFRWLAVLIVTIEIINLIFNYILWRGIT